MKFFHIFLGLLIIALMSNAQIINVDKPPTGPSTCPVPADSEYTFFFISSKQ